jgi:hypothetical protein
VVISGGTYCGEWLVDILFLVSLNDVKFGLCADYKVQTNLLLFYAVILYRVNLTNDAMYYCSLDMYVLPVIMFKILVSLLWF